MTRKLWIIRFAAIALALVLVACSGSSPERPDNGIQDIIQVEYRIPSDEGGPGSTTLGVAEITYQTWSCREGLVLFRDALIGNRGESKSYYDQWLSPISCESARRLLPN